MSLATEFIAQYPRIGKNHGLKGNQEDTIFASAVLEKKTEKPSWEVTRKKLFSGVALHFADNLILKMFCRC